MRDPADGGGAAYVDTDPAGPAEGPDRIEARVRAARPEEAPLLSALAMRSKGHWGYDAAFMRACRLELTLEPEDIRRDVVNVLETPSGAGGFYALRPQHPAPHESGASGAASPVADLELFYVEPEHIGRGFGRLLWGHMVEVARGCGYKRVSIESDPNAQGFYLAMGARHVGDVASGSIPGRRLPLLRLDLDENCAADRRAGPPPANRGDAQRADLD